MPKRLGRDPVERSEGPAPREALAPFAQPVAGAVERERRRIARGLHDEVGPLLALARLKLGELLAEETEADQARPDRTAALESIRALVDRSIHAIRSMTFELRSPPLGRGGLDHALRRLGCQVVEPIGIRFDFRTDAFPKPISRHRGALVCRAVRELLVNTAKHSRARTAGISSVRIGRDVRICVGDDGVGFQPGTMERTLPGKEAYGLGSVVRDVRRLGGRMAIDSAPGKGTRVILDLPLAGSPEPAPDSGGRA